MRTKPSWSIAACVISLCTSMVSAQSPLATSSGQHAWVVMPSVEGRAILLHIPGDTLSGTVRRVPDVHTVPVAIGAHNNALLLAFRGGLDNGQRIYNIRKLETRPVAGSALPGYSRPKVLPPLLTGGDLIDLAQFDQQIWALVRINERVVAYSFYPDTKNWAPTGLPDECSRSADLYFPSGAARPTVVADEEDVLSVWTRDEGWSLTASAKSEARVVCVGESLYLIEATRSGQIEIRSMRESGRDPLAQIDLDGVAASEIAAASLEGRVVLLWESASDPAGGVSFIRPLHTAVVSTNTGVIYEGPARTTPPVTVRQLEVLAFVVLSIAFAVGVFVLHPIRGTDAVVSLPKDAALAPPSRRIIAALVDSIPCVYLTSWVWDIPIDELLALESVLNSDLGIRPLLTAGGLLILHSAIGEAIVGRTIGKWLTTCRTVSRKGGHPGISQAVLRNTMKVLCPPLVLMSVFNPGIPWPGSFGTFVVVQTPKDSSDVPPDKE